MNVNDVVEFIVSLSVLAIPIIGLTGYFIFKIAGMIMRQRAVERLYLERLARARAAAR